MYDIIQLFHGCVGNSLTIEVVENVWEIILPKAEGFGFDNTYCIQKMFPGFY